MLLEMLSAHVGEKGLGSRRLGGCVVRASLVALPREGITHYILIAKEIAGVQKQKVSEVGEVRGCNVGDWSFDHSI